MNQNKNPALRVEFRKPCVESPADLESHLDQIAKDAGFPSATNVLSMTRFKMKKSGKTERAHGSAIIEVCKGCPQNFLALFQRTSSFRRVELR